MTELRKGRPGDEAALRALWESVFGPEKEFIDAFFRTVYDPGETAVAELGGEIVSAAYVIGFGGARYIYAVGTRPDCRGRGLGEAVTMLAADGREAYLCPAGEELRDWYVRRMGARCVCGRPVFGPAIELTPISPEEYAARREELLSGRSHPAYPRAVLELFGTYGSFYADGAGGVRALAEGRVCEAVPCDFGAEPWILGLNGAPPICWGLTFE